MDGLTLKRNQIKELLQKLQPCAGILQTPIKGFSASLRTAPTFNQYCFYKPMAIIVLQGKKQAVLGSEQFIYNENQLIVTVTVATQPSDVEHADCGNRFKPYKITGECNAEFTSDKCRKPEGEWVYP